MSHTPTPIDELKARPTLTVAETARVLGVGKNTAYEAIKRNELPSLKIGGRVLVPTARLFALLEDGSGA